MAVTQSIEMKAKCVLASLSLFDYCKIVDSPDFYDEEKGFVIK